MRIGLTFTLAGLRSTYRKVKALGDDLLIACLRIAIVSEWNTKPLREIHDGCWSIAVDIARARVRVTIAEDIQLRVRLVLRGGYCHSERKKCT